jgi:hypothetical protein
MVDPIPNATDYCRSIRVANDSNGNAWLYTCGKTWVLNSGDAFMLRFQMTPEQTVLETAHIFDWGPSDSFSSILVGPGPAIFLSGPAGDFADRNPSQFTVLFKFFDP